MFMIFWNSRVQSFLILNIACFLTLLCQKTSTCLARAKKKVKS